MKDSDENEIYHEMYLHLIWSTHGQKAIIVPAIANSLYRYISDIILDRNCHLIAGKVFADHLQLIIKFNHDIALEDLVTDIKVGSALWVNNHCLEKRGFAWQKTYFGFSVSQEEVGNLMDGFVKADSFLSHITAILSLNGITYDVSEILV
jgi:putative transposase